MGGVLEITAEPECTWLPQGWLFDAAVQAIARRLPDAELAERLRASTVEDGSGYADLRKLDAPAFGEVVQAARAAVVETVHEGPRPGAEPSAFARLVWGQSLLATLLAADPRWSFEEESVGTLVIADGVEWTASPAAFRLAVEHLAGAVRHADPALADRLLTSPSLAEADAATFRRALVAVTWMRDRYAPDVVLEAKSPAVLGELWPSWMELAERMAADPRSG